MRPRGWRIPLDEPVMNSLRRSTMWKFYNEIIPRSDRASPRSKSATSTQATTSLSRWTGVAPASRAAAATRATASATSASSGTTQMSPPPRARGKNGFVVCQVFLIRSGILVGFLHIDFEISTSGLPFKISHGRGLSIVKWIK